MIGLFLPRQRVVSLLHRQHISNSAAPHRLAQPFLRYCRNSPFALVRNNEQQGSGDVSAPI